MAEMLNYATGERSRHPWARTGTVLGWVSLVLLLPVASLTGVRVSNVLSEWERVYWAFLGLRFVLAAGLLWVWHRSSSRVGQVLGCKLAVEAMSAAFGAGLFAHYIWGKKSIPSDGWMALAAVVGDALVGLAFAGFLLAYRGRGGVRTRG